MTNNLKKYFVKLGLILIWIFLSNQNLFSQNVNQSFDPQLYNGKIYTFFPPYGIKGNQFYFQNPATKKGIFVIADVELDQKIYKNLELNYDIYHQQVIARLALEGKGETTVILPFERITQINAQEELFVSLKNENDNWQIFQKIGNEKISFYIYWYKRFETKTGLNNYAYVFSETLSKTYIIQNQKLMPILKNKDFLQLLDKEKALKLKKYLQHQKIKVDKASADELIKITEFYKTL